MSSPSKTPQPRPSANTPGSRRGRPASEPPSEGRSLLAIRTPGSAAAHLRTPIARGARTPATTQPRSASGRKATAATATATPHARAAFRALDDRRTAIFNTPGRNRRRSGRDLRESPRDLLRALGRRLEPESEVIPSSASHVALQVDRTIREEDEDEDDDIPIDRPRLSLPIDMEEEDSELHPHTSAGIEDTEYEVRSVERLRRAISEQPRSSLDIRMSDYIGGDVGDITGRESTFFQQGAFDAAFDDFGDEAVAGDLTIERLDSPGRRETLAGRPSDFGTVDLSLGVQDETTFFLEQPAEPSQHDMEELGPAADDDDSGEDNLAMRSDSDIGPEDLTTEVTAKVAAANRTRRKKKRGKISKYGIEYPSLPPGVVKRLAQGFAQTSGIGKSKISPDTLSAIMQASHWFFEQLGDDLEAYAKHAGRKTIDESDMLTLMKRQRQTSSSATPFSLAQRHLPRELLQELRMAPPLPVKKRRKTAVEDDAEDDA